MTDQERADKAQRDDNSALVAKILAMTGQDLHGRALDVVLAWRNLSARQTRVDVVNTVTGIGIDLSKVASEITGSGLLTSKAGANARQIGGDHYESELQHWDVIESYGIGYLEGCGSKYVTRTRKKNGLQDLEKSVHYAEKLIELNKPTTIATVGITRAGFIPPAEVGQRGPRGRVPMHICFKFAEANKLDAMESAICTAWFRWQTADDLQEIIRMTHDLIKSTKANQPR